MHKYHQGRRSWDWVLRHRSADYDQITESLSRYHILAGYYRSRAVSRRRVRALWFGQIARSWPAIESYIAWRRERFGFPGAWDDLVWLAIKAGASVNIPEKAAEQLARQRIAATQPD